MTISSFIVKSPAFAAVAKRRQALVICGFFDSTAKGARQGGALHKTVAGHAETAYFD
jgi:hypothetical protein